MDILSSRNVPIARHIAGRTCVGPQDNGLCKDVFQQEHMVHLRGRMGLAHCRYPTAGGAGLLVRGDKRMAFLPILERSHSSMLQPVLYPVESSVVVQYIHKHCFW